MELRHMRYFAALAEHLSFTRAAAKVHVTQSTLSHQIKKFEDEIGVPLFERAGKKVIITEAGETLLPSVTRALNEIDSGLQSLRGTERRLTGRLRIGATHIFNVNLVPSCVATFLSRNPSVMITAAEYPALQIEEALRAEKLDIGIGYKPSNTKGISFEPLYDEEMALVVSRDHPLASRKRVRMFELHRQPMVLLTADFSTRVMLDEWFASVNASPAVVVEMNAIAPMLSLVDKMEIATIVPRQAVPDGQRLVSILIESPTPIRTPGLLSKVTGEDQSIAKSFAAIVRGAVAMKRLSETRADRGQKSHRR